MSVNKNEKNKNVFPFCRVDIFPICDGVSSTGGFSLQFPCTASCTSLCSLCQFLDYQNYIRNCCMKDIPAMERSIALCNGISQWVQLMVLSRPTAQLRAEVFTKFIRVAEVAVDSTPHRLSVTTPSEGRKKKRVLYLSTSFMGERRCLLSHSGGFVAHIHTELLVILKSCSGFLPHHLCKWINKRSAGQPPLLPIAPGLPRSELPAPGSSGSPVSLEDLF